MQVILYNFSAVFSLNISDIFGSGIKAGFALSTTSVLNSKLIVLVRESYGLILYYLTNPESMVESRLKD